MYPVGATRPALPTMSRTARRNASQQEILARLRRDRRPTRQQFGVLQEAVDAISHHVEEQLEGAARHPTPELDASVGPNWRTPSSPLGNHIWVSSLEICARQTSNSGGKHRDHRRVAQARRASSARN